MTQDRATRIAVTLAVASFLSMMSAPANWHWAQWFAYLPFFWVLREETTKENRWFAFLFGFMSVAVIFRWVPHTIGIFSNIPMVGAYALHVLFSATFGLPYFFVFSAVHPLRRRLGDLWILALPAWLVVIEFLSMWLLLFPYQQGVAQFGNPPVFQLASVTGVWGLSFLVYFVNCALAEGIYREREGRPFPIRWVGASLITASLLAMWGTARFNRIEQQLRDAPVLYVQQIQLDTTMQHRMSTGRKKAFIDWFSETRKVPRGSVDLVVWSEGSSAYNVRPEDENNRHRDLSALTRDGDFELLLGGGTLTIFRDAQGRPLTKPNGNIDYEAFNSVYLIGRDGTVLGRYDKNVPLPFGEYLPLSGVFPWLADLIEGPGNFKAGTGTHTLEGADHRFASPICYEAILPSVCRSFDRPDMLVNVTNDAWFTGPATYQHGMLATIRATELGTPLFRAAYTGSSLIAEPHGHVYAQTQSMERVNRPVGVRMARVDTIYARFGDWFVYLCMLGLAAAGFIAPWREQKRTGDTPVPSGVRSPEAG